MTIYDGLFAHPPCRTQEESRFNSEALGVPLSSDSVLNSNEEKAMANDGYFACEETMKLQHMCEHRFRKLAQVTPAIEKRKKCFHW